MAKKSSTANRKRSKTSRTTKATKVNLPSKSSSLFIQLTRLQLFSAVVFILLAVVAGVVMRSAYYQLNVSHVAKDELASQTETVLVPATHNLYDLNLRWVLVSLLALSAVVPLLLVLRWRARYQQSLKDRVQTLRWVDIAVTMALATEMVALLCGVHDLLTLKLIAGLVVISAVLGWFAEHLKNVIGKVVWTPFVLGILSGGLAWWAIIKSLAATYIWGMTALPWYAYVAVAILLLGSLLFSWNHFRHLKIARGGDYGKVERNYLLINLVTKVVLAAILIVAFK